MVGVRIETDQLSLKLGSSQESSPRDEITKQKKMTIFFNGEMRVLDVTETQARAIICSAMKQIENEKKSEIHENNTKVSAPSQEVPPPIQPSELSMKQSLQRFLQKRKARMAATTPYSQRQLLSFPIITESTY